jgi:hypothetical protein
VHAHFISTNLCNQKCNPHGNQTDDALITYSSQQLFLFYNQRNTLNRGISRAAQQCVITPQHDSANKRNRRKRPLGESSENCACCTKSAHFSVFCRLGLLVYSEQPRLYALTHTCAKCLQEEKLQQQYVSGAQKVLAESQCTQRCGADNSIYACGPANAAEFITMA